MRYDLEPVPDTDADSLDWERIENYFWVVLDLDAPASGDREGWMRLLLNTDLLARAGDSDRRHRRRSAAVRREPQPPPAARRGDGRRLP